MLNLRRVAITGGLSSGKSSVCRFFNDLGATVVSADQIVHTLLNPDTELGNEILKLLGNDVVIQHGDLKGQFDRQKIAEIVFRDPVKLKKLESILHPAVRKAIYERAKKAEENPSTKLFVAEIPLLFESGGQYENFITIAVVADQIECQKRFMEKSGYPPEEFTRRMQQQMTPEEKARQADFVIRNNGTLEDLHNQVEALFKQLTKTP